jgi:hypothetical protein
MKKDRWINLKQRWLNGRTHDRHAEFPGQNSASSQGGLHSAVGRPVRGSRKTEKTQRTTQNLKENNNCLLITCPCTIYPFNRYCKVQYLFCPYIFCPFTIRLNSGLSSVYTCNCSKESFCFSFQYSDSSRSSSREFTY